LLLAKAYGQASRVPSEPRRWGAGNTSDGVHRGTDVRARGVCWTEVGGTARSGHSAGACCGVGPGLRSPDIRVYARWSEPIPGLHDSFCGGGVPGL